MKKGYITGLFIGDFFTNDLMISRHYNCAK